MPLWRKGMAVGEWKQIPNSALASAPMLVKTYPGLGYGPQSKVTAWNGFAIDTRDGSIYSAANGGHTDYAGNEVNRIKLTDDVPRWTEPRSATPASQVRENGTHYADGRPTSRHTCYGTTVNQVRNRVMILGGSRWGNGYMLGTVDGFNLGTNDWDPARTYPDETTELGSTPCPAVTENKATGDLYMFASWKVMRWSNSTNQWSTVVGNASVYGQYAASAMDTKRNRVLLVGGNANDHGIYNVATNTTQTITLTGTYASALSGDGNGMVYDPLQDAFLLRKGGSGNTVYRINASTFAVDVMTTTNGTSVPATTNGVWSRFLYVPQLKGVVYAPTYDGNLWFLRTAN